MLKWLAVEEKRIPDQISQSARKMGILMLGEYKALIWLVSPDDPKYHWTVQRLGADPILHSGKKDSFEAAAGEAHACLDRLTA